MQKPRILVVGSVESSHFPHILYLATQGYRVETAKDRDDALEMVSFSCPEIVILDADDPTVAASECCRQIKSSSIHRYAKVVIVSSRRGHKDVSLAFAAGCDEFLVKPVERGELVLVVKDLLKAAPRPVSAALVHPISIVP